MNLEKWLFKCGPRWACAPRVRAAGVMLDVIIPVMLWNLLVGFDSELSVPWWLQSIVNGLLFLVVFIVDARTMWLLEAEPERCHECGYCVRHVQENRCPECGSPEIREGIGRMRRMHGFLGSRYVVRTIRRIFMRTEARRVVVQDDADVDLEKGLFKYDLRWAYARSRRAGWAALVFIFAVFLWHLLAMMLQPGLRPLWPSVTLYCGALLMLLIVDAHRMWMLEEEPQRCHHCGASVRHAQEDRCPACGAPRIQEGIARMREVRGSLGSRYLVRAIRRIWASPKVRQVALHIGARIEPEKWPLKHGLRWAYAPLRRGVWAAMLLIFAVSLWNVLAGFDPDLSVPAWLAIALLSAAILLVLIADAQRMWMLEEEPERCHHCGYGVRHAQEDRCPGCGAPEIQEGIARMRQVQGLLGSRYLVRAIRSICIRT